MQLSTATLTNLHALLIGIDTYRQAAPDSGGGKLGQLRGCVRDVERMRGFLVRSGVPSSHVHSLTTAPAGTAEADGPPPTRQAILDAFAALLRRAAPGEQALVHYSGHGTRLATAFGDGKRAGATHDEALVPWDGAGADAALLRDVEIAYLLKRFVEKGVFVTLVLDCCHSGGSGLRGEEEGPDAAVRWADELEGVERPLGDGLASYDELVAAWRWWWEPKRDWLPNWQTGDSGWLALPSGYALVAACAHDELAHEVVAADGGWNGLLTDRLLAVLEAAGGDLTCRQLEVRLRAAAVAARKPQHPQVEGEIDRTWLAGALRPTPPVLRVLTREGSTLCLDGGRAHGLRPGARVLVWPEGGERRAGSAVAAVLCTVGAVESRAVIEHEERTAPPVAVATGDEVVIDDPGDPSLALAVEVRCEEGDDAGRRAVAAFDLAAREESSGFLRAAGVGELPNVILGVADGRFHFLDGDGRPLGIEPLAAVAAEASRVVRRLGHYARFRGVERLANDFAFSVLAGRLELELGLLPDGFDPQRDEPRPRPLPRDDRGVYQVRLGQWICLTLRNRSRFDLHAALLNLRPDWAIRQLLPVPGGGEALVLPASPTEDRPLRTPLRPGLPEGSAAGRDLLKVLAATTPTRFAWLTLPPLDDVHRAAGRVPESPLEALMARWGGEPHRDYEAHQPTGDEWTTVQVESRISRG